MRVHLALRRTLDWSDLEALPGRILASFRPRFALWHEVFEMPYGTFRQRLKEISLANHARVEGAEPTPMEEVPAGDLIVPVDDDDWLAPDLATRLRRAARPDRTGYVWTREVVMPSRRRARRRRWRRLRRRLRGRSDGHLCATNNYAVVAGPGRTDLARRHLHATRHFEAHPGELQRVRGLLAVQNRNVASQTALGWREETFTREQMIAVYEEYRGLYEDWEPERGLRWAQPCLDAMTALMAELRPR